MTAIIGIENLKVICIIGCNPSEWLQEQEIFIDLKVETDISLCVSSQQIKDTIDYDALAALCSALAINNRYKLLEALAWDIVHKILENGNVQWCWTRIKKPQAIPAAQYSMVEFQKRKP